MEIASSSVEGEDDFLEALCGTRWRVCWVSPLRNLRYTEARLKQYAMHLRGVLQSDSSGSCVGAKVTALPELRRHENTPIPLQISIEKVDSENKSKCVYNGIMLSWTEPRRPGQDNFVHLPLLLCRGGMKATEIVHKTLQAFFDCSIIGLTFKTEDMSWVIGFAANYHNEELDNLHLKFNCPGLGENENFLEYTIQMTLLKEIWGRIHGPDQVDITLDKIMQLRNECYDLLEGIYAIKVQMLQLIEIKWKGCSFSLSGYMKFSRKLGKVFLKYVEHLGYAEESSITGMLNQN